MGKSKKSKKEMKIEKPECSGEESEAVQTDAELPEDEDEVEVDEELPCTSTNVLLEATNSIAEPGAELDYSTLKGPIQPGLILQLLSGLKSNKHLASTPLISIPDKHIRLIAPDGLLFKPALVKKELIRYWKLAALSEVILVEDAVAVTKMFLQTAKALRMYPDCPKQPPTSAYQLFMRLEREKLKEENPDISFGSISKEVGERWKHISPDQRRELEEMYEKCVAEYHQEMLAFFRRHPNLKGAGDAFEAQLKNRAETPAIKPKVKSFMKKKKDQTPIFTGFDMYCKAKGARYADKYDMEEGSEELVKKIKRKYDKMSEQKRSEYEEKAVAENKRNKAGGKSVDDVLEEASKAAEAVLRPQEKMPHIGTSKTYASKVGRENKSTIESARKASSAIELGSNKNEKKRKRKERDEAVKHARLSEKSIQETLVELGIDGSE